MNTNYNLKDNILLRIILLITVILVYILYQFTKLNNNISYNYTNNYLNINTIDKQEDNDEIPLLVPYDFNLSNSYNDNNSYNNNYGYTRPKEGQTLTEYIKDQDPELWNTMENRWNSLR